MNVQQKYRYKQEQKVFLIKKKTYKKTCTGLNLETSWLHLYHNC